MLISEWGILSQSCIWVMVLAVKERMLRPLHNVPHSIVTRIVLLWNIHKVHTQPTETYIMMWFGQANWSSLISPMKKNCWMRFCVVDDADVSQCSLCGSRDVCSFPGWGAMAKGLRACFYISQFCTTWNAPLCTMGRCQTTSEITQAHQLFCTSVLYAPCVPFVRRRTFALQEPKYCTSWFCGLYMWALHIHEDWYA